MVKMLLNSASSGEKLKSQSVCVHSLSGMTKREQKQIQLNVIAGIKQNKVTLTTSLILAPLLVSAAPIFLRVPLHRL